jgi:uncharacterized membrane protein YgcG
VAVLDTTSGMPPRSFATRLFNHWGIGHAGADDGILLFVAMKDRKAEIVLGDGLLKGRVSTAQTDAVMAAMTAEFKAGRRDGGLIGAAQALANLLAAPAPVAEERAPLPSELVDRSPRSWVMDLTASPDDLSVLDRAGDAAYARGQRRLFFVLHRESSSNQVLDRARVALASRDNAVVLCLNTDGAEALVAGPGLEAYNVRLVELLRDARWAANRRAWPEVAAHGARLVDWSINGVPGPTLRERLRKYTAPLGAAGVAAFISLVIYGRRWNRYRPRDCKGCGRPRQRLAADAETVHLEPGQRTEQQVGSVDYDVWWCAACQDVWINDNVAWFSSYSRCPKCSARTRQSRTTTERHATEYSTGLERIDESCAHCDYRNTYTRTTARIVRTSSSSSRSSWSSGSSSRSSFSSSSSSSSSRSSFGGGRSSGGGSSGSW